MNEARAGRGLIWSIAAAGVLAVVVVTVALALGGFLYCSGDTATGCVRSDGLALTLGIAGLVEGALGIVAVLATAAWLSRPAAERGAGTMLAVAAAAAPLLMLVVAAIVKAVGEAVAG